jgi:hypothetical protein
MCCTKQHRGAKTVITQGMATRLGCCHTKQPRVGTPCLGQPPKPSRRHTRHAVHTLVPHDQCGQPTLPQTAIKGPMRQPRQPVWDPCRTTDKASGTWMTRATNISTCAGRPPDASTIALRVLTWSGTICDTCDKTSETGELQQPQKDDKVCQQNCKAEQGGNG